MTTLSHKITALDPSEPFFNTPLPSAPCSHGVLTRRAVRREYGGYPTLLTVDPLPFSSPFQSPKGATPDYSGSPCIHDDPTGQAVKRKYGISTAQLKRDPAPSSVLVLAPCTPDHQTLVPVLPVWNRTPGTPVPVSIDLTLPYVLFLALCGRIPDPSGPSTNASATPGPVSALTTTVPESETHRTLQPCIDRNHSTYMNIMRAASLLAYVVADQQRPVARPPAFAGHSVTPLLQKVRFS